MASLVLQDTFQPYYAGRDGEDDREAPLTPSRPRDRGSRQAIRLPSDAPAPSVEVRRDRRAVAH